MFLIYIKDLTHSSHKFNYIRYADDTTLIYTQPYTPDLQNNINSEIRKVTNWFKSNRLLINPSKANYITFFNRQSSLTDSLDRLLLKIDNFPLNKVNTVNFLGVHIDYNMRWDTHVNKVTLKVSKCIGILYRLKDSLPHSALLLLYNSFMLSYLNYCVAVWGNCSQTNLDKLFKLQEKSTLHVSGMPLPCPLCPIV